MKQLFEYAVLLHEYETTEKNERLWKSTKMVINPTTILAKDDKEVLFKVTREIPSEYAENPDDIQILIKGF